MENQKTKEKKYTEPKCPICNDLGWIEQRDGVKRCSCKTSDINLNIYQRMRIPKRYRSVSLKNFQPLPEYGHKKLLNEIEEYIYSDDYKYGKGLMLIGPPGVGKTHLAVSILKEFFLKRGIAGLFYDTRKLLFDLKATFDGSSSGRKLLEEVVEAPILVLDDLGNERLSDWAKDIIHYIIITRYNELRPIIITSNIDFKTKKKEEDELQLSLEERLGYAIASRLSEMCKIIEVKGKDLRNSFMVQKLLEDSIEKSND